MSSQSQNPNDKKKYESSIMARTSHEFGHLVFRFDLTFELFEFSIY
jgi:hypothetical protein